MAGPEKARTPRPGGGGRANAEYVALALHKKEQAGARSSQRPTQRDATAMRDAPATAGGDGSSLGPNCPVPWAHHDRSSSAAPSRRRSAPPAALAAPADRRHERRRPTSTPSGNLTTFNVLPPVEAPTGFADLGVPRAHRRRPRRVRVRPAVRDPDRGDPGGDAGPRRVRSGQDRVRQDARLRRADAGPHHRRGRAVASRSASCSCRPASSPCRSPRCSSPSPPTPACACSPVYGGASRHHQIDELAQGRRDRRGHAAAPDRPAEVGRGRSSATSRSSCLDEADRMADDGFTPQVEWILRHCTGRNQTMLFSATLDGDVGHLIRHYLTDPVEVAIDAATDTVGTMHHLFLAVHHMDKDRVDRRDRPGRSPRSLVFCQTKRLCDRVATALERPRRRRRGDPRRPAAERPRAGAAQVRRGQAGDARRHRRRRPRASTSTTSARSSTTTRPRTPRTTCTVPAAPPAPGATAGRSRSSSTTSTPRCASCSARCGCRWTPPIEVFTNDVRLLDLASFAPDESG